MKSKRHAWTVCLTTSQGARRGTAAKTQEQLHVGGPTDLPTVGHQRFDGTGTPTCLSTDGGPYKPPVTWGPRRAIKPLMAHCTQCIPGKPLYKEPGILGRLWFQSLEPLVMYQQHRGNRMPWGILRRYDLRNCVARPLWTEHLDQGQNSGWTKQRNARSFGSMTHAACGT